MRGELGNLALNAKIAPPPGFSPPFWPTAETGDLSFNKYFLTC